MTISEQQITSLFIAYFNRAPAKNGYDGWVKDLDDGVKTYEDVSAGFIEAPEFKDTYGEVDVANDASLTTFVTAVYQNVLGREGSVEGIANQVAAIKSKEVYNGDLAKFMAGFTASAIKPFDPTDPKWDNLTDEQKAAADTASDKINNKMLAADYFADTLAEKTFINGAETPEAAAKAKEAALKILSAIDGTPESLQEAKALIDEAAKDPATAIGTILDADLTGGSKFVLKPSVDTLILTDASDTITGESSTIGADDTIIDTSITDNDVMNVTLTGDMTAATITNVENINVALNTLGGTKVDAENITGANITVGSTQFGFSGQAEIDNLGKNDATAGENISELTVKGITQGTIDTGSASSIIAKTSATTDDISLKVHGDVALDAITNTYTNLNIDADKAAVVDLSNSTNSFTGKGDITGEGDVTLKTAAANITTKEVTNSGTGELTIELTDSAAADLKKVATDKVITDVAYTDATGISYDNGSLDVTAKATANDFKIAANVQTSTGGSIPNSVTVHLTQAASGTEKINTTNVTDLTVDAQKGGTITEINATNKNANVTLIAGDDLTVTDLDAKDHAVIIDAASKGDIELTAVQASVINATLFTQDLKLTQSDDENIAVVGAKGKNTIETIATDKTVTIKTQDGEDTLTIKTKDGKLTVETAGGDDTVTATDMTTSAATFDLGDGKNAITVKNLATGDATITSGAGVDTLTVEADTAGKVTASLGAGNDIANIVTGLADTAEVTLNLEAGDDIVNIDSNANSTETITINAGDGNDTVEVTAEADFVTATLAFNDVEALKVDTTALFNADQLTDQTFTVSSGTSGEDIIEAYITSGLADSESTYDFSTLEMSTSSATAVEYFKIEAEAGAALGDETIVGVHNAANIIDLGAAAEGKETVQLFADSMGTTLSDLTSAGTIDVDAEMVNLDTEKVSFDIAVIDNFTTEDDSLILGEAATATNYASVGANIRTATNFIDNQYGLALDAANTAFDANSDLTYVYVFDNDDANQSDNSYLFWDTDGNGSADAAIMLVGLADGDGTLFVAADIIAG